jgi:hypothetical protein
MKKISTLFILSLWMAPVLAQTPTWSADVAEIIYSNCSSCHREGSIGPFSLMSYDDAVLYSEGIKSQTSARLMPPWHPDPALVHFKGERILSDDEINTLAAWVDGGTPAGNLAEAPPVPVFPSGSQMAVIDQTIDWPTFTLTENIDQYRTFVIHSNYTEDVFLNQIEYLPGNDAIVHHMVLFYDPTSESYELDEADPLPGYESFGLGPVTQDAVVMGAWAPGSGIFEMPSNFGIKIPAGADLALEIHYSPNSSGQSDNSVTNFKFTTAPDVREVYIDAMINHLDNSPTNQLFVPANTVETYTDKRVWNFGDLSLISVFPHMHLIGTEIHSWATKSGDTTHLISIPDWDFHWQGFYQYQKLLHITNGSTFWGEATYDNTSNNPDNPNDPPQDVEAGEHTTDEMMIVFFAFAEYEPGDENIILDSTLISGVPAITDENYFGLRVFPNPAADEINVGMNLGQAERIQFTLFNASGEKVKEWSTLLPGGVQSNRLSVAGLSPGWYLLRATSASGNSNVKVMKQ